ncbi:MAG: phosphatase PAP2 family protein [Chthoniobacterales bacterium]
MLDDRNPSEATPPEAGDVEKADIELGTKLAKHRDHPVAKAAAKAGKIGDQGPLYALSAGLLAVGISSRDRRLTDTGLSMLAAIATADVAKRVVKRLVHRTRPHVVLDEGRYQADAGGSDDKHEQSFPSGHMAGTTAVARALARNHPEAGAVAAAAAIGIGMSRIAKGAHWPLDVAAGAVIGLAAEGFAALFFADRRRQRRKTWW